MFRIPSSFYCFLSLKELWPRSSKIFHWFQWKSTSLNTFEDVGSGPFPGRLAAPMTLRITTGSSIHWRRQVSVGEWGGKRQPSKCSGEMYIIFFKHRALLWFPLWAEIMNKKKGGGWWSLFVLPKIGYFLPCEIKFSWRSSQLSTPEYFKKAQWAFDKT